MTHEAWSLAPITLAVTLLIFGWMHCMHDLVSVTDVDISPRPHHLPRSSSDDYKCFLVDMAHATGTVLDEDESVSKCIFVQEHKSFPWTFMFSDEEDKNTSILWLQSSTQTTVNVFAEHCNDDKENVSHPNTSDCYFSFQVSLYTFTHNEYEITCLLTSNINATTEELAPNWTCFYPGKDINSVEIVSVPLFGHIFDLKSIGNKIENSSNNNLISIRECSELHSCYAPQNLSSNVISIINTSRTMRNARNFITEVHSRDKTYSYTISNSETYKKQPANELTYLYKHYTHIHNCSKSVRNDRKMSFFEVIEDLISKDKPYSSYIISNRHSYKKNLFNGLTDLGSNLYSYTISSIEYHKIQILNRYTHLRINYTRVHNGSVVEPAIFEKMISDKNADVGRQRFKSESGTETEVDESLTEYFDSVIDIFINIARRNMQEPKTEKIKIPDISVTIKKSRFEKSLRALGGWILGVDSLHRKRSSRMFKDGSTFHISTELQFDELKFGYDYLVNFPLWRPRGKLEGVIPLTRMEIKIDVPSPNGTECNAIIGQVEVTEWKNVCMEINGTGFLNNLSIRPTSRLLEKLKTGVAKIIPAHVKAVMQRAMSTFSCGPFAGVVIKAMK